MKKILTAIITFLSVFLNLTAQTQNDIEWPTLAESPWPMIKHDPQFSGRSQYKGPQTPTVIWTIDMPSGIFSGPVIGQEGNLYFGSYFQDPQKLGLSDYFYCYGNHGEKIWEYKSGTNRPPQSGILIDSNNTVYFGSLDKYFYALNSDGTLKWKYETSNPIVELAIPNIDLQGNVYITNGNGELISLDPNGNLNWSTKYEDGFFQKSPVFSPDGNTLYIAGKDSNLYALNLDGSLKWKFRCNKIEKAPAIDSYGNMYFAPFTQYLVSLDSTGNILWIYDDVYFGEYSVPTIDKNGNLYAIAIETNWPYYYSLISISYDGTFRWTYVFDYEQTDDFWQPLICDSEGTVYVGSTFGYFFYAISSEGELKWKLPLNDYQVDNTGAIAEDGTLYLGVHKSSLVYDQQKTLIAIRDTSSTSVNDNTIIDNYSLEQNFPNPFNPATTIKYQLPSVETRHDVSLQHVTLKIYDILGNEIATLVNEHKKPGIYEVEFDASQLPSGVYIYQLITGSFRSSKKMVLMK